MQSIQIFSGKPSVRAKRMAQANIRLFSHPALYKSMNVLLVTDLIEALR